MNIKALDMREIERESVANVINVCADKVRDFGMEMADIKEQDLIELSSWETALKANLASAFMQLMDVHENMAELGEMSIMRLIECKMNSKDYDSFKEAARPAVEIQEKYATLGNTFITASLFEIAKDFLTEQEFIDAIEE